MTHDDLPLAEVQGQTLRMPSGYPPSYINDRPIINSLDILPIPAHRDLGPPPPIALPPSEAKNPRSAEVVRLR
jgi:hypothetical protein